MNQHTGHIHTPWTSLVYLLALTLVSTFVLQFLVVAIDFIWNGGMEDLMKQGQSVNSYMRKPVILYLLLMAGTVGTFLIPPLVLQRIERYQIYFPRQPKGEQIWLITFVFLFAFSPLMHLVSEWNAQMSLPETLRDVEQWMQDKEESMKVLFERVIMVDSIPLLLLNIVVLALLPAIAEEFYFRGTLFHILNRLFNNNHLTVWIVAIVFSAIHLQFYGFFPRMLLGAFFGYMLVWAKNIWVPVFAHFVNNAMVTILAFIYTRNGKTYEDLQSQENYSIFVYIGSLILTGLIGYWFYRYTHKKATIHGARLDKDTDIR